MLPVFADIRKFIVDTFFPVRCVICRTEDPLTICTACQARFTPPPHQRCIVCGLPSPFGLTHPTCQTRHTPDQLLSIYNYHNDQVAQAIIAGKYSFIPKVYEVLGNAAAAWLVEQNIATANYIITPLPLHTRRERWRGYNQSRILVTTMAETLGLPVVELLRRNRYTKTQKELNREQRITNMQNSFILLPTVTVRGKDILLVDDVTTTGSTLQAAAEVLKRNGANRVLCLTAAQD